MATIDLDNNLVSPFYKEYNTEKFQLLQTNLAKQVIEKDTFTLRDIRTICGLNTAYLEDKGVAAACVLTFPDLHLVELKTITTNVLSPYMPEFLAMRELPAISEIFKNLETKPDIVLIKGHGIAHPRRCGLASHFGITHLCPTIGIAKKRLIGEFEEKKERVQDWLPLFDHGRIIGAAWFSSRSKRPLFVSIGTHISLESSIEIVRQTVQTHFLPEPLYQAHHAAKNEIKKINP
ncbi:MAG: endonuclease V [Promethearchaeota archaeon]